MVSNYFLNFIHLKHPHIRIIMSKNQNPLIGFFASVKLALFVLFCLATFSIIGTIIPQKKPMDQYVELYGENTAKLFQILDFPDMYGSWWFVSLLILLCLNLIVCTLERIPSVWQIITQNNLDTSPERLAKMRNRKSFTADSPLVEISAKVKSAINNCGWKTSEKNEEGSTLFFTQQGPWTRLGVYVVHTSILLIFVGALIGKFYGYKGSMMIPETRSLSTIREHYTGKSIGLDFEVLCKKFNITYYPNEAPKEFLSELVIREDGKDVLSKSIVVNDPLKYKGHTFYQSSYDQTEKLYIKITNKETNQWGHFLSTPGKKIRWEEGKISFGVINQAPDNEPRKYRYKLWFKSDDAPADKIWFKDGETSTINQGDSSYEVHVKEFFYTGLQVTKDPGVWYVYVGCIVMLLGLGVAFFMSHRRVWVYLKEDGDTTTILVSGLTNKNKIAFEKDFNKITDEIGSRLNSRYELDTSLIKK